MYSDYEALFFEKFLQMISWNYNCNVIIFYRKCSIISGKVTIFTEKMVACQIILNSCIKDNIANVIIIS